MTLSRLLPVAAALAAACLPAPLLAHGNVTCNAPVFFLWSLRQAAGLGSLQTWHRIARPLASRQDRQGALKLAIDLMREVLQVPDTHRIGIVPGSDTGAVEMAMWTMLGARPVTPWPGKASAKAGSPMSSSS
jgi:hypothetical protein